MKKPQILVAIILSAFSTGAFAQGFYLGVGLGFAIPQAGQSVYDTPIPYYDIQSAYNGTRTYTASGSQTYDIKTGASFSAGLSAPLTVGYMFSDNVGIQLDARFGLTSSKYTFSDDNFPLNIGGTTTVPYNISTTQHASEPIFLSPSLVLQTNGDQTKLYSRFGLVLPLDTKITQDQVFTNAPGTGAITVDDFTWKIKNSFSLGFAAAVGVKYKLSDHVSIWGELSIMSLTIYTKEQDLTSWAENGQSVPLSNYGGAQTIKFSKTATLDSTYSQFPPYAQPFSNMGLNVGVIFNLSNRPHSSGRRHSDDDIDNSKPFKR